VGVNTLYSNCASSGGRITVRSMNWIADVEQSSAKAWRAERPAPGRGHCADPRFQQCAGRRDVARLVLVVDLHEQVELYKCIPAHPLIHLSVPAISISHT